MYMQCGITSTARTDGDVLGLKQLLRGLRLEDWTLPVFSANIIVLRTSQFCEAGRCRWTSGRPLKGFDEEEVLGSSWGFRVGNVSRYGFW